MSTSRKQMRDNLEEAAGNLMEYVSSDNCRQDLIENMRRVYEEYNAPREKWFFGYIYRLYRTRTGDISLATKKLEDNASETDGLEIIANYFKTGAWNETSANTILMRILVEKVETLYKYDHHPLDLEQVKRLNMLFIRQVNIRIKENLFFDMGRKDRRNEIDDINNANVTDLEASEEAEVVKSYVAPPRRKIDFANNPAYKKVATELTKIFTDPSDDEEDVVKSYVAPPRRKIRFGENPEYPDINLSHLDEKLSEVFSNKPESREDDDEAVGVRLHGQIDRFEHYYPEEEIQTAVINAPMETAVDDIIVNTSIINEEGMKEYNAFFDDDDFEPRGTEDLLTAHEDARNMGFSDPELTSLLSEFGEFGNKKLEIPTDPQTYVSSEEIDALIAELNDVSIPVEDPVAAPAAVEHIVTPSKFDLDMLIAELNSVLARPDPEMAAQISPEENKELSAKERFAANRKKIESHFAEIQNRRAEILDQMEEEEEGQNWDDEPKSEAEDDDEKSEYSQSSESSSSEDSSDEDSLSDSASEASENSSDWDDDEDEDLNEGADEQLPIDATSKERFVAARSKVDALFASTLQRRDQIVKETKVAEITEKVQARNDEEKSFVIDAPKLADTLKPVEEARSPKERFALASKNINTLFGATMNRRAEIEKAATQPEETNQISRKFS